jgi:hypothetical protein
MPTEREYRTGGLADHMLGRRAEEQQIGRAARLNADHDEVAPPLRRSAAMRRTSRLGFPLETIVSTRQYAATVSGTARFKSWRALSSRRRRSRPDSDVHL